MTDYSAVGKKSRNKGGRFERQMAKELTEWWGYEFNRVPASGGASLGF